MADHDTHDHTGVTGVPAAATTVKLDDLAAPDDNTDLNATTSAHGLLQKLPGGTTTYLRADGTFATPSGSGLTAVPIAFVRRNGANYTLNNSGAFSAIDSTNLKVSIAAASGDILEISLMARYGNEAVNAFIDAATIVSAAAVNWISGGTGLSTNFGVAGWVGLSGVAQAFGGSAFYTVQAGDISGGNVEVRLMYRTSSAANKTLNAGTSSLDALFFAVKNLKQ